MKLKSQALVERHHPKTNSAAKIWLSDSTGFGRLRRCRWLSRRANPRHDHHFRAKPDVELTADDSARGSRPISRSSNLKTLDKRTSCAAYKSCRWPYPIQELSVAEQKDLYPKRPAYATR